MQSLCPILNISPGLAIGQIFGRKSDLFNISVQQSDGLPDRGCEQTLVLRPRYTSMELKRNDPSPPDKRSVDGKIYQANKKRVSTQRKIRIRYFLYSRRNSLRSVELLLSRRMLY